jgi:uncharacterized heparinase superfamily protein
MTLGQIAARMYRRSRQRLLYPWAAKFLFPQPTPLGESERPDSWRAFHEERAAERRDLVEQADDLLRGRYTLINLSSEPPFTSAIWDRSPQGNRLWLETLHYGEWALDLAQAFAVSHKDEYKRVLTEIFQSWLDHNPVGKGPAWNPYTIARRLVFWTRVHFTLAQDAEWSHFWRERLEPSLRRQASFLEANLEKDVPNNHLISNYRALAWVGILCPHWPEAVRLRRRGLEGLWRQMRRQVLPDGVHFERSFSYHTSVLQDLLETWHLTLCAGVDIPEDVRPTLVKMMEFLVATRAADGTWPMVNDSVPGYPIDPSEVLRAGAVLFDRFDWARVGSESRGAYRAWFDVDRKGNPREGGGSATLPNVFPDSGYVVLRDGEGGYLLFDAGPVGPEEIPGHGHADALSFVLYGGGRPLIVDPGVYSYEEGSWRNYFRSTRVHNTISVDGEDQCVLWGAFRVAHQPRVHLVGWSDDQVTGSHEGYARLAAPVFHRRSIRLLGNRSGWEIHDCVEGHGEHDFALTLQFAPGAKAEVHDRGCVVVWSGGVQLRMTLLSYPSNGSSRIEKGWVSSDWNLKQSAHRYVLIWRASPPINVRWVLELGT